jgi:hypothetical protein
MLPWCKADLRVRVSGDSLCRFVKLYVVCCLRRRHSENSHRQCCGYVRTKLTSEGQMSSVKIDLIVIGMRRSFIIFILVRKVLNVENLQYKELVKHSPGFTV